MELGTDREPLAASDATSYPFLNHSHSTLTNDLPPDVDNKPLARQRRKRTSPEDQAILETAYKLDPKPDKNARLKLVEQIALGEKEVQIWFQNRRQTSRRKSRPLLPHEIAQFQMSRYGRTSMELSSDDSVIEPSQCENLDVLTSSCAADGSSRSRDPSSDSSQSTSDVEHRHKVKEPENSAVVSRRSMPTLSQILSESSSTQGLSFTGRPLKKATSFVRISTAGGKAQVVTKDGLTPSPPRQNQAVLDDSQLETGTAESDKPQASFISSLKRSLSGRSRDSRAWEFWCDKEGRTELEDKAERDGKGSAADAIGVIRATSNRKVLQPLPAKHTLFANRQPLCPSRRLVDGKRPGLQRAQTSSGRLQHVDGRLHGHEGKRPRLNKPTVLDTETSTYIPGNESDKENWSPERENMPATLKKGHSMSSTAAVGSRAAHGKSRPSKAVDAENIDPEADEEVAAFMRGSRSSSSLSGAEELDCVQGLLSLSQGRWVS